MNVLKAKGKYNKTSKDVCKFSGKHLRWRQFLVDILNFAQHLRWRQLLVDILNFAINNLYWRWL